MITKKDIEGYDFKTMEDYFDYINLSKINGNYSQVSNLIKELSQKQRILFNNFLLENRYECKELIEYIIKEGI